MKHQRAKQRGRISRSSGAAAVEVEKSRDHKNETNENWVC
jgi:hypothetical protein